MDLNPQSRYVRWFFWSLGIWDTFLDKGDRKYQMEECGTNLCFFFRTVVLYAPLVLLLHAVVYGAVLAALTIVPIRIFGGSGYFSVVGAITVLILAIITVKKWREYRRERRREIERQLRGRTRVADTTAVVAEVATSPTFFQILWEWIVAGKKKVCPRITFSKQEVQS